MALSPFAIRKVDSVAEKISRKIWGLPTYFPTTGLHVLLEDLGLNVPPAWGDYCGAALRSWAHILNDEGALKTTARASLQQAATKFRPWLLELTFHSYKGHTHSCPSIMGRNMATLLTADLYPTGGPEIWSGNKFSTSFSYRIPIQLDEEGCLVK
jgi:hypothetical protein